MSLGATALGFCLNLVLIESTLLCYLSTIKSEVHKLTAQNIFHQYFDLKGNLLLKQNRRQIFANTNKFYQSKHCLEVQKSFLSLDNTKQDLLSCEDELLHALIFDHQSNNNMQNTLAFHI